MTKHSPFRYFKASPEVSPLSYYRPLKAQPGLGVGLGWLCGAAGTPSLFTHQFQAKPCCYSLRVASIIERIDLGCASNVMLVLICLTAANRTFREEFYACRDLIADSIGAMRFELRKAVDKYNTFRPHHALKGKTPMEYLRITQVEAA